jgi:hypothetical protein
VRVNIVKTRLEFKNSRNSLQNTLLYNLGVRSLHSSYMFRRYYIVIFSQLTPNLLNIRVYSNKIGHNKHTYVVVSAVQNSQVLVKIIYTSMFGETVII